MTDQEIIAALRQHSFTRAMKSLYKYRPAIMKLALQNNGSKEDAEDLFQDALVLLCRRIKNTDFILTSSLNTYLYSIAKNVWRDALRKRNKVPVHDITEDLLAEDISYFTIERTYEQAEQAFLLLGEKCKEILSHFYFHKLSMAEIGKKLGFASERVAKNQKYRCLEKARENYMELTTNQQ